MRVGIFVVMAGRQAGGPETYEQCLVRRIVSTDRRNDYHLFCLSRQAADSFDLPDGNVHRHVLRPSCRWLSIPISLPAKLLANRVDLLHATFTPPPFCPVDYIFTMHCFSTFAHPEFYPPGIRRRLNALILRGLKSAKMILCVSENVRDHVAERFGISQDRLAVVYHGVGDNFRPLDRAQTREMLAERYGLRDPYLLFVGKLEARKNIARIIEAFARFRAETKTDTKLVLAGKRTWGANAIDEALDRHGVREHVKEVGYVKLEDMPLLYNGAEMFLFPSLWEGFGLPVIEAMACGTPVIASNTSCLPEVAGNAAMLIDPTSVDDLAAAMTKVSADTALRQSLRCKGLERAKFFTWDRAAEQTLAAYEQSQHV